MKSVVRKRLLSLSSQQQSAQSQEAQRGRCGFRNGFVVNQHLGDAVFRDLCHARLNFGVAGGNIQAEQIQIEISSQLIGFDGSQFNSSASGKAARIQYAGEDDCFSLVQKPEISVAVRVPCSSAVNVPKFNVKLRPSPRALLDSNINWELPSSVKELTLRSPAVVVQSRVLPDSMMTCLVAPK